MANRLSPQFETTSTGGGKNRLAQLGQELESQNNDSIFSSVGNSVVNFFGNKIKRLKTDIDQNYKDAKRYGELFVKVRNKSANEVERTEFKYLEDKSLKEAMNVAMSFGPSPLKDITGVTNKAKVLKESAQKSFSQALAPTTKVNKQLTEKVVPGLLERKQFAFTKGGLETKFHEGLSKAGDELEKVLDTIPAESKSKTKPVLEAIKNYKKAFYVSEGAKRVIVDEVGYKNAEKLENLIKEFGEDVSFGTIRKTRQILDIAVTKGGKAFGRTVSEGSLVDAQREAANAIREELAKQYPNLNKVNAEYSFWKNAHKIIRDTIERTKSQQTPLGETIAEAAGGAAGLVSGVGQAVTTAVAFKWIKKLLTSTGYRTLSAIAKNELADAIAAGKFGVAEEIIRRTSLIGVNKYQNKD